MSPSLYRISYSYKRFTDSEISVQNHSESESKIFLTDSSTLFRNSSGSH